MPYCCLSSWCPLLLLMLAIPDTANAFVVGPPCSYHAAAGCHPTRASTSKFHYHPVDIRHQKCVLLAMAGGESEGAVAPITRSESHEQAIETLKDAVETRKAPMLSVFEALRTLAEETGLPDIMDAEDVEGRWELLFSTQLTSGYSSMRQVVGFYPSREEITADSTLGPLPMGGMRGHCLWNGGVDNELAFTMETTMLGPFEIAKDKTEVMTYKFFFHDGKMMAAKNSDGGYSLLSRAAIVRDPK